jgi:hypothetical protein
VSWIARHALGLFAGASFIACVATTALWWRHDAVYHARRAELQRRVKAAQDAYMDWVMHSGWFGWGQDHPPVAEASVLGPEAQALQKELAALRAAPRGAVCLMVARISAVPPLAWFVATCWTLNRQESRRRAGRCVKCGYDLRASPRRCPECGKEVK